VWRTLLLLSLVGCVQWPWEGEACGGGGPFTAGFHRSTGGSLEGSWDFPHVGAGPKTMVIERRSDDSAVVRISYQRGGKTIVETWAGKGENLPDQHLWGDPPPPRFEVRLEMPTWREPLVVEVGKSQSGPIRFHNVGNRPVTVTQAILEGEGFQLKGSTCGDLQPSASCTFTVEFAPASVKAVRGKLTVTAPPAHPVSGTFVGAGRLGDAGSDAAR